MKKYFCSFIMIWFVLLSANVVSKSESKISYVLYNDSESKSSYQIKNEINSIFQELIEGIDERSYRMMIVDNREAFQVIDKLKSEWKNDQLIFTMGDGKGVKIKGILKSEKTCFAKVKPKSLLYDFFN
ncbi:MAG: hypothetical protein RR741_01400 [Erysipelotrichaceae bacterium]